jgi:Family of unknown function (DUF5519)
MVIDARAKHCPLGQVMPRPERQAADRPLVGSGDPLVSHRLVMGLQIETQGSRGGELMNDELLASIEREVLNWPGMSRAASPGGRGRGGYLVPPFTVYRLGRQEIGHVHNNGVADLPFPKEIYDQLIADGRARPHPAGFAGVVSYHIRTSEDVPGAVELFRMNYEWARTVGPAQEA